MSINIARWFTPFCAILGLMVASSQVQATFLPSGGTVNPDGNAASVIGGALADTGPVAYLTAGGVFGTIRQAVYRDTSGGLDFLYRFTVDAGSPAGSGIVRMSTIFYNGFTLDVSAVNGNAATIFAAVGGAVAPTTADRSPAPGTTVGFNYPVGSSVLRGDTSYVMVIRTNALLFGAGFMALQDGGNSANIFCFCPTGEPISQVPEPGSIVLLASCFLGLGGVCAWRRWNGTPTPA
jgi:hypothetical protein